MEDMKQYILNARNFKREISSHIEDYRSEEEMIEGLKKAEHAFKQNPWFVNVKLEDRKLTVVGKEGHVIEYYITEREI